MKNSEGRAYPGNTLANNTYANTLKTTPRMNRWGLWYLPRPSPTTQTNKRPGDRRTRPRSDGDRRRKGLPGSIAAIPP